jgi:leucyl-tRNA synthetase
LESAAGSRPTWTICPDEGISGPRRFLDKVWALVGDACRTHADDEVRHETLVKYHQTVKRVTEGLEELRYNSSIAALMELVNALRADSCTQRTLVEGLVVMLAPYAPHFAEESWERLGHGTSIFDARWPGWDEGLVVEDQVEVVIQVSGKTRGRVSVSADGRGQLGVVIQVTGKRGRGSTCRGAGGVGQGGAVGRGGEEVFPNRFRGLQLLYM